MADRNNTNYTSLKGSDDASNRKFDLRTPNLD